EISAVGNDGMVGIAVCMGGESTPSRTISQSKGHAYRMPSPEFKNEVNSHTEVRVLMLRYTQALITQMSQTVVCTRHQTINQERWRGFLSEQGRARDDQLVMTKELVENMLGVRREVGEGAARHLQLADVIEYHRWHITVTNRPKLEALCCEC